MRGGASNFRTGRFFSLVFVKQVGILLNFRSPSGIMPNDFHGELTQHADGHFVKMPHPQCALNLLAAACSKRGVLFILLLGFNLQSVVGVAR